MKNTNQKRFRIYTYWNNEKHYLLKNGNLAPGYMYHYDEYKSYAKRAYAIKVAKEKNLNKNNLRFYVE